MRGLQALLLVLATSPAGTLRSQESRPASGPARVAALLASLQAEILAELQSEDLARSAWGARHAGDRGFHELARPLREVLRRTAALPPSPRRDALAGCLLDALVRVDVTMDASALEPWARSHTKEVLILASRTPRNSAPLLASLVHDTAAKEWRVAAALARPYCPERLVEPMLGRVRMSLVVCVRDAKSLAHGRGGKSACASELTVVPEGFPPRAVYTFGEGNRGLISGPPAIAWSRAEYADRQLIHPHWGEHDDDFALDLVLDIARLELRHVLRSRREETVRWRDPQSLESWIAARRVEYQKSWDRLLDELIRKQVLEEGTRARFTLPLTLSLWDQQGDQTTALPELQK